MIKMFEITELICPESIPNVVAKYNVSVKVANIRIAPLRMMLVLKTERPDGTVEEHSARELLSKNETKEYIFEIESVGVIGVYKHEATVFWNPLLLKLGKDTKTCETKSGTVLVISADRWEGALKPDYLVGSY